MLRNIYVNLKNSAEEQIMKITQLECEVNKAMAELQEGRVGNLPGPPQPSRGGTGQTPVFSRKHQLPSSGGAKKLYSEALSTC
jgi:hypothetical protein